ncbi:TPA: hypothetical protein DDW35_00025 [Candidatus Sumerlaeota bacterium]|nr:hypothetical protein [Candidatus Sumerlaeota bacterium]
MRAHTPEPAPDAEDSVSSAPASSLVDANIPPVSAKGNIADEMFLRQFSRQVQKRVGKAEPVKARPTSARPEARGSEPRQLGTLGSLDAELKRLTSTLEQSPAPVPPPALRIITPGATTPPPAPSIPLPPTGAILLLPDEQVAVFQHDTQSNGGNLDSVLLLNPNGSLRPEGLSILEEGQWEQIGQIPPDHLPALRSKLMWNRHHIVFHLAKFTDARFVPHIKTGAPKPAPQPVQPSTTESTRHANWPNPSPEEIAEESTPISAESALVRGQVLSIEFTPGRSWEAVYWCEDAQGTVVAHNTNRHWSLMHLDLTRFQDSLVLSKQLEPAEIAAIESELLETA